MNMVFCDGHYVHVSLITQIVPHINMLCCAFQGKKGESGLPGVDGLPGPAVRTVKKIYYN